MSAETEEQRASVTTKGNPFCPFRGSALDYEK